MRIFYRQIFWSVLFLTTTLVFASCARQPSSEEKIENKQAENKKLVGFSQTESNGPWRLAETKSMRDEAAKRGYELIVTDAQASTAKQISDVETLIARRVGAIFLAPREIEGFALALAAAKESKIPVFLLDRETSGKAGEDYVTFIGSNFVEEGRRAGEWVVKNKRGKANVVILEGTAGASVVLDRTKGFADAVKASPDIKILAAQNANFTRAEGRRAMENLIEAHGKNISIVYAHNDEMALGAIDALKAAGMKPGAEVLIVSIDGQKSALEAIVAGEMNATVECNPRFGPIAFDTYEKFLRGEPIPPKIIVPDRFFDKNNAAQFIEETY